MLELPFCSKPLGESSFQFAENVKMAISIPKTLARPRFAQLGFVQNRNSIPFPPLQKMLLLTLAAHKAGCFVPESSFQMHSKLSNVEWFLVLYLLDNPLLADMMVQRKKKMIINK